MKSSLFATRRQQAWLALGVLALFGSAYRFGIAPLAWVAPVPFLIAQRASVGWRDRLWLLLIVTFAAVAQVAKIITAPLPLVLAIPFALPTALSAWLLLVLTETVRRRLGEVAGVVTFASLTGVSEWFSCAYSPLGLWGTGASTQVSNLVLLQSVAIWGVPGVGVVMALFAGALAAWYVSREHAPVRRMFAFALGVTLMVYAWGAVRLDQTTKGPARTVAGIVVDPGPESAADVRLRAESEELAFARTRIAAKRGAELVIWNEAALFVLPESESALLERVETLARENNVDVVAAYAVVLSTAPPRYDNKYVWVAREGHRVDTYRKHHPVPGEPSLRGDTPLGSYERPYGRVAGAICYDFDFPETARTLGRQEVGLVALPSSDWRGIDPYHTEIARIGAIAGGFSVVRPVRAATSAAFDAHGRSIAALPAFADNERIMMSEVPVFHIPTLYSQWGDGPLLALCVSAWAITAWLSRRGAQASNERSAKASRDRVSNHVGGR